MSFSVPVVAKIKVFGPEKALINEPTFEIIISIKRKKSWATTREWMRSVWPTNLLVKVGKWMETRQPALAS